MSMTDRVTTRIDPAIKKKALKVFGQLGLSEAEAIRLFYAQVILHHGIPFPVKIPNAETLAAFEESRKSEKSRTYKNFRELRTELGV